MKREFRIQERSACPICLCETLLHLHTLFDDRFGLPDLFDVMECQNPYCGLAFLKQEIVPEELPAMYSKYYHHYDKKNRHSSFTEQCIFQIKILRDFVFNVKNFYRQLTFGQKVLDVGCGYGPSLSFIKKRKLDWIGLEIDPVKSENNRMRGLNCFSRTLESYAFEETPKFDVIIVNQVIEHSTNPGGFMRAIAKLLSDGGTAYFSTPNYYSKFRHKYPKTWIHWHVPYHQMYYSPKSFSRLATQSDLKIDQIFTQTPFPFYALQNNITMAKQGQPNNFFHSGYGFKDLNFFKDIGNFFSKTRLDEDNLCAVLKKRKGSD